MHPGCNCIIFRIPLINTVYKLNLKTWYPIKWWICAIEKYSQVQFLLKNSFIFTEKLSHTNIFKSLHFFKAIYFLKKEDLNIFDKYTHGVTLTNSHATYILHNEEIEYTRPTLFNIYIENIQSCQ